ncbi:MAG: hypothetical protein L0Y60_04255 [Beijerinckiaceae bacterium]|nr:hypothetical protein [Beijerinckiaceae bacterium]
MTADNPKEVIMGTRPVSFSIRLRHEEARRVVAIAEAHEWSFTKTIQKLVIAALDAKLVK